MTNLISNFVNGNEDEFGNMKKPKSYLPFSLFRVLLIVGCIWFLSFKYISEHPKAEWDESPEALIISYELGPTEISYGYIPDFRIWGDGHIVWVNYDTHGERKVFEGYLSHEAMEKLINKFVDAGYFDWFGGGGTSYDYMQIRLIDKEHNRLLDANQNISQLVDYLKLGAGLVGKEFTPTIGYLYVFPVEETEYAQNSITVEYS